MAHWSNDECRNEVVDVGAAAPTIAGAVFRNSTVALKNCRTGQKPEHPRPRGGFHPRKGVSHAANSKGCNVHHDISAREQPNSEDVKLGARTTGRGAIDAIN